MGGIIFINICIYTYIHRSGRKRRSVTEFVSSALVSQAFKA
jgi:hypothetical protein